MDITDLVYPRTLSSIPTDCPAQKEVRAERAVRSERRALSMASARSFLREPLVHFLVLGALLFLVFKWTGGSTSPGSNRIVITQGQIENLAVGFTRSWQRPATEAELKGLIDDYVKEEIAVREAVAMGLDRDDVIIRRRLRQKLEFITEDTAASNPPTDAELQAWMTQHPESFRSEPQVAFRQVYLNTTRRGAAARAEAAMILTQLRAGGSHIAIGQLGDSTMLPSEQPLEPLREVARSFGDDFAQQVTKLEPGMWTGPLESSFGLHLVLVEEKIPAARQELSDVRPLVEREFLAERRKTELQSLYERLSRKYSITVDRSQAPQVQAAIPGGSASR
jgi:PPIC-type PPIASE domain